VSNNLKWGCCLDEKEEQEDNIDHCQSPARYRVFGLGAWDARKQKERPLAFFVDCQ
jgi:hypothetical protein